MYEKIPDELKIKQQWVNVWNKSKIPMRVDAWKAANSSISTTWGSFEDAAGNVEDGAYDGIGFVFADDGLIGIDVDVGFDADGFLSPLAIDIIRKCESYTEKSRSGRGVHILLKGDIPFKGANNRAGVEIYKSNRYFIMTGNVLLYAEIIENQEAIDYVLSTYFSNVPVEGGKSGVASRIYSPIYRKPENGKVFLKPEYPPVGIGNRHLSMVSLAGQMHGNGYDKDHIYKELLYVNEIACQPQLPESEILQIVNSVTKYRR